MKTSKNLEDPQRWNRYVYSLDNPIKYFDPDGRDIALSTKRRDGAVKEMLVQTVMRPSGRAALQSLDSNHSATVTYEDSRINTKQDIQNGGKLEFGNATNRGQTTDADGNAHTNVKVSLDTKAIQEVHPDPSGVTTVSHETVHGESIVQGMSDQQIIDQDTSGSAEAVGQSTAGEKPDITRKEAKKILKKMLKD